MSVVENKTKEKAPGEFHKLSQDLGLEDFSQIRNFQPETIETALNLERSVSVLLRTARVQQSQDGAQLATQLLNTLVSGDVIDTTVIQKGAPQIARLKSSDNEAAFRYEFASFGNNDQDYGALFIRSFDQAGKGMFNLCVRLNTDAGGGTFDIWEGTGQQRGGLAPSLWMPLPKPLPTTLSQSPEYLNPYVQDPKEVEVGFIRGVFDTYFVSGTPSAFVDTLPERSTRITKFRRRAD